MTEIARKVQDVDVRSLSGAIGLNFVLGILYAWSLFLQPLETLLQESRTALSLVPGLGLLCFTFGVFSHDWFVQRHSPRSLVWAVLTAAGAGFLIFGLVPSLASLTVGYGIVFGFASGLGYGVALFLARQSAPAPAGWAVGMVVAAFAAGGMCLSAASAAILPLDDIAFSFLVLGTVFCVSAVAFAALVSGPRASANPRHRLAVPERTSSERGAAKLTLAFFVFCYLGLMLVSHGTAILVALGLSADIAALAPALLNSGYIVGAYAGGAIAARYPSWHTPACFLGATAFAVMSFSIPALAPLWLLAIVVAGAGFGSTVSVFMMLLTAIAGADEVGARFARMNVGYGVAGVTAPVITAWLYDASGSYDIAIWFACGLGALGLVALFACRSYGPAAPAVTAPPKAV